MAAAARGTFIRRMVLAMAEAKIGNDLPDATCRGLLKLRLGCNAAYPPNGRKPVQSRTGSR